MKLKEVKITPHYDIVDMGLKFSLAVLLLLMVGFMVEFLNLFFPFKNYMSQIGHSADRFTLAFIVFFASFLIADLIFSINNIITFFRYTFIVISATGATALFYNYTLEKNILTTPDFLICVGPVFAFLMLIYMVRSVYLYYKKIEFKLLKQYKLETGPIPSYEFLSPLVKMGEAQGEADKYNKATLENMKSNWIHNLEDNGSAKLVAYNLFKHRFKPEYKIAIKPSLKEKKFLLNPEPMELEDIFFEPGSIIAVCDKKQYIISSLSPQELAYFEEIENIEELKKAIWCEPQTIFEEEI